MDNLYLVLNSSSVPLGIFTWSKMLHCFSSPNWNQSQFIHNQWATINVADQELKVIQVMINQDMPISGE